MHIYATGRFYMAKSQLMLQARELRKKGKSLKHIAHQLHVSRSSVSRWIRDIILTREQQEVLLKRSFSGGEVGRQRSAEVRKERRKVFIEEQMQLGRDKITFLSDRELLLVGLALYWGEGSKKNGNIQFCNSDPGMVQFLLLWLRKCFSVPKNEITCWVGINEIHKDRELLVKEYWSRITGISLSQFNNTSFKRVINQKVYENFEDHFGTLFVRIKNPMRLYFQILGMIDALGKVSQGSSVG